MTVEQIETFLSARTDSLDRAYMNRTMTECEYRFHMKALDRWAERAYRRAA